MPGRGEKKKMHRYEDCCISSIGLLKSTIPSKYDPFQTFLRVFTLIPKVPISHLSIPEALLMCHALAVCGGGFPKAAVVLPCFWRPWEVRISHLLIPLWMICYKHLFSWSFVAQSKKVLGCYFSWKPMETNLDCLLWALSRLGVCRESQLQSAIGTAILPFCLHVCPLGCGTTKIKIIRNSCSSWSWFISRRACTHWKRQAMQHRCSVFWIQMNLKTSQLRLFPLPVLQEFEWLEYYAGRAACTTAMRRAGHVAAKFDLLYFDRAKTKKCGKNSNYYDLLTPAGFALLG